MGGSAAGIRRLERRMTDILMDTAVVDKDWRCSNRASGGGARSTDTSRYYLYVAYKDMEEWYASVKRRRLNR